MSKHDIIQNIVFAAVILYFGFLLNKLANKLTNDELQEKNNQKLIQQMRNEFAIHQKI